MENEKIVHAQHFLNTQRKLERENEFKEKQKPSEHYAGEIKDFINFCNVTQQEINYDSLIDYLYVSVEIDKIKIRTWDKRYYAIKSYINYLGVDTFTDQIKKEIGYIRTKYKDVENKDLIRKGGKKHINKEELLKRIYSLDVRPKAICMVNLVTASRPSEMVRLQIKHFDFESRNLEVYLKKQEKWVHKRLDLDSVIALQEYIKVFKLTGEDYLIGSYKHNKYKSVQVTEHGYRKMLKRWTGVSPYTFRKTQVVHMHTKGADLTTIAVQTGHKDTKTISDHYLDVSNEAIDKFL